MWRQEADTRSPAVLSRQRQSAWDPPIRWSVVPLVMLDTACLAVSMLGAYHFRFQLLEYGAPLSRDFYVQLALVGLPMWILIFALHRLYDEDELFGGVREYARVFNACTIGLVSLILYTFLARPVEHEISRGWLVTMWVLSVTSVAWTRFGYRRVIYRLRERGHFTRRVLIVGANEEGQALAAQLQAWPRSGLQVVGFADPRYHGGAAVGGLTVLGTLDGLAASIQGLNIQELIVVPTALQRQELLDLYRDWGIDERVRIRLSSGLYELFTTGIRVSQVGFVPLVSLNRTRITGADALMKAAFDYAGALVGVVVLAPVFVIIAALVRLTTPGPAFHRRGVIGLYGQEFDAYKFRTMIVGADAYLATHADLKEAWEREGKIPEDPRVTRVGRFLRAYSLDELPQLFNVLRGEMSLVGPRMITPGELDHFGGWKHNLLTVKPGLTGLWQVNGRADTGYDERVRLDMAYIRNYTIWLDLRLLFETVWAVLRKQGAY